MKMFFKSAATPVLILLAPVLLGQEKSSETRDFAPIGSPRAPIAGETAANKFEQPELQASKVNAPGGISSNEEKSIRDSVSAADLAWAYYDKGEWDKAQEWFTSALEWYSGNLHAAEGLVLSMFEGGDPQMAYLVARELDEKIPGIRKLVVESASSRARYHLSKGEVADAQKWVTGFPADEQGFAAVFNEVQNAIDQGGLKLAAAGTISNGPKVKALPEVPTKELLSHAKGAMQEGRYRVSQWYLNQAEAREPLDRENEKLRAWNYYHTRQFELGAAVFEKLYRADEDLECAEGLSFCLQQSQDIDRLTKLSGELGGMLMATAAPMIETAKDRIDPGAPETEGKAFAEQSDDLPYAPIPALRAAGEEVPGRKTLTRRLQAQR